MGVRLLTIVILFLICATTHSQTFPYYTYRNHPLLSLPEFSGFEVQPEVVHKYYFHRDNERLLSRMYFAPRSTSYLLFNSGIPFATDIDALITPGIALDAWNRDLLIEVHLNHPARVIALLGGRGIGHTVLQDVRTMTGIPPSWPKPQLVEAPPNRGLLGDPERFNGSLFTTLQYAFAFEIPLSQGNVVKLPHAVTMGVNNLQFDTYVLLFARPEVRSLRAFDAPVVPPNFQSFVDENVIVPALEPPLPNRDCPRWLHDLHVVRTRHVEEAATLGEPQFWRTWHPAVDPIYWCYYNHEHGAYPGEYKPMFGYTPFKTPGENGGRQDESHEGFKVFSFPVDGDGRIMVLTVHMHLAISRRFYERHHTVIAAVFRSLGDVWEMQMELHMKMDFGGAEVTLSNGTTIPADKNSAKIINGLNEYGRHAGRRFNVLNIDDDFPDSVDKSFFIKGDISRGARAICNGIYEQWKGPLNNCCSSRGRINQGFIFDVRDPTSAMRFPTTRKGDPMQWLNGHGVNKVLAVGNDGVQIGLQYCNFSNGEWDSVNTAPGHDGIFHTDPYMSRIEYGGGDYSVRQFISPTFTELDIPAGGIAPIDPWIGPMHYVAADETPGRFLPIEESVLKKFN